MRLFLCLAAILAASPALSEPSSPPPVVITKGDTAIMSRSGGAVLCSAGDISSDDYVIVVERPRFCAPNSGNVTTYGQTGGVTANSVNVISGNGSVVTQGSSGTVIRTGQISGGIVVQGNAGNITMTTGSGVFSRLDPMVRSAFIDCVESYASDQGYIGCLRGRLGPYGYTVRLK